MMNLKGILGNVYVWNFMLRIAQTSFFSGFYTSNDVPVSLQNTVSGSGSSTPLSSSVLAPPNTAHSQQMSTSPSVTISVATVVSTTQVRDCFAFVQIERTWMKFFF